MERPSVVDFVAILPPSFADFLASQTDGEDKVVLLADFRGPEPDIQQRLLRAGWIDTRKKLLVWAEERWPEHYKRSVDESSTLEESLKLLWSDYLWSVEREV